MTRRGARFEEKASSKHGRTTMRVSFLAMTRNSTTCHSGHRPGIQGSERVTPTKMGFQRRVIPGSDPESTGIELVLPENTEVWIPYRIRKHITGFRVRARNDTNARMTGCCTEYDRKKDWIPGRSPEGH